MLLKRNDEAERCLALEHYQKCVQNLIKGNCEQVASAVLFSSIGNTAFHTFHPKNQNFDYKKSAILAKKKSKFWLKIEILAKNRKFGQKLNFWLKSAILAKKTKVLLKTEI